jgi:hypothetical protein
VATKRHQDLLTIFERDRISASRGSAGGTSGGGESVTACDHPETMLSHRGNTAPAAKT